MTASCISCAYSQVDHGDDFPDGPLMRCHRYPPQVFVIDGEAAQTWPNVGPGDWCGEFSGYVGRLIRDCQADREWWRDHGDGTDG